MGLAPSSLTPAFRRLQARALAPGTRPKCDISPHEPLFSKTIASLFKEGVISNGSVVDCGAHQGGEACFYADLDQKRVVHAVEPLLANVEVIQKVAHDRPNIQVLQGALGSSQRWINLGAVKRTATMLVDLQKAPT